jgi:hypothetical protein
MLMVQVDYNNKDKYMPAINNLKKDKRINSQILKIHTLKFNNTERKCMLIKSQDLHLLKEME